MKSNIKNLCFVFCSKVFLCLAKLVTINKRFEFYRYFALLRIRKAKIVPSFDDKFLEIKAF